MINLTKTRYTKEQHNIWRENFLKAIESLYKKGTISKYDYYKFKKSVEKGYDEK